MDDKDKGRLMEKIISNDEKYDTYRNLMVRLKVSLKTKFWYEAIFIEYAILEDRLCSVISHSGGKPKKNMAKNTETIRIFVHNQESNVERFFTEEMLDNLDKWRSKRNKLIHSLTGFLYNNEAVKIIAEEGDILTREFADQATKYRKYRNRKAEREGK